MASTITPVSLVSSAATRAAGKTYTVYRPVLLSGIVLFASVFPVCALPQEDEELGRLIFEPTMRPVLEQDAPAPSSSNVSPPAADSTILVQARPAADQNDPAFEARLQSDIERYRRQIAESGNSAGLYSANLREQHEALAGLLQQSGDHAAAITEFENAMHIERVNQGLYTLEQIPLVEKIIASHTSLGNFQEVDDYHEYLYYIQLKSFPSDDPRLLVAKEEWADWNVESYLKQGLDLPDSAGLSFSTGTSRGDIDDYVAVQNPRNGSFNYVPRSQLPFLLNPYGIPSYTSGNDLYMNSMQYAVPPERLVDERLRRAEDLYEEIIEAKTGDEGEDEGDSAATGTVEYKLANIAFAVKKLMDQVESRSSIGSLTQNRILQPRSTPTIVSRGYRQSMEALEAIAVEREQQLEQDPAANPAEAAQAYIYLGDWHIGYDRAGRSEEAYAKAWEILQANGVDEAGIAAMFAPEPLVPVPAFAIHDYSRRLFGIPEQQELEYKGYIDLTLDVDRFGNVRGVNIDGSSPDTSEKLRRTLRDYLRDQKMRPAFADGKTIERSDLKIRYNYTW